MELTTTVTGIAALKDQATEYILKSKADNTLRAYRSDWDDFGSWCQSTQVSSLPAQPATVCLYLTSLAQRSLKCSTIQRRVTAISQAHKSAGLDSPTLQQSVRSVMAGIRRVHGVHQEGKAPVLIDDVRAMVAALPESLQGKRDRALILLGFAGAFRRSELVSLATEDLKLVSQGLIVHLRRSKVDQNGLGRVIAVPYGANPHTCPVRAVKAWLDASPFESGPVFRAVDRHGHVSDTALCDRSVALIVKRAVKWAGLDPTPYSGHSLRSGFATSAAAAGADERSIMEQTGHRSVLMVRRYIRNGSLFSCNAAATLGL